MPIPNPRVPQPGNLSLQHMAELLAEIQEVLWGRESRPDPDDVRNYVAYWNPHKEWDTDLLDEIAEIMEELRPPEAMPYEVWADDTPPWHEWPNERWTLTSPITPNKEPS